MDISRINNSIQPKCSPSPEIKRDCGFKEIFTRKLTGVNPTHSTAPADGRAEVLGLGDKILNLLEDYAKDLTNPAKTLKDIQPIVETIEKKISQIESKAAENVSDDKEFEKFVKDLVVTANVAAFKFHRGDYV